MEVMLEVSVERVALKPAWLARLLGFRVSLFLPCTEQIEAICQVVSFQVHICKMKLPVVMALGGSTKVSLFLTCLFKFFLKNLRVVMSGSTF